MPPKDFFDELNKDEQAKKVQQDKQAEVGAINKAGIKNVEATNRNTQSTARGLKAIKDGVNVTNPDLAKSGDIANTVDAINKLNLTTFNTNHGLPQLADNLVRLTEAVQTLQKDYESKGVSGLSKQLTGLVGQLQDVAKVLSSAKVQVDSGLQKTIDGLKKSIDSIDFKPSVNVTAPKAQVVTTPVNLDPVVNAVKALEEAFKNVETPEPVDLSGVSQGLTEVQNAITSLRFPVPNYVLPFKTIDGKDTQVVLDASGNVPTSGGGGGGGGTQYAELITTAPGTGTLALGRYKLAAPTLTDGQMYGLQLDSSGNLKVTGSLSVGGTTDSAAWTAASSTFNPAGGVFNDSAAALTTGQQGTERLTANRAVHTNLRNAAGTEVGTSGVPLRIDPTGSTAQPVTGTFWQATQPVSLATNTPTLQSGSTTAVTQATASNLNATVVGTGTFAVQATLSAETTKVIGTVNQGTSPWVTSNATTSVVGNGAAATAQRVTLANDSTGVIATVGAVTAITNALPAGSNVIGHVITDTGSTTAVTGTVTVSGTVSVTGVATASNQTNASQKTQIVDGSGNVIASTSNALNVAIVSGGGSGGTSSSFAAAFPATGTAIGVKNGANMVNLTADGSSNLNVNLQTAIPAGTNVIGHVIADSGSTTAVTGNVTVVQGTGTNLHAVIDTGSTTAVTQATAANLNATVVGTGTFVVQATLAAETTKVIGTVNQGTSPWVTSNATTSVVGNGAAATAQRVTLANDSTGVIATVGAVTAITNALPAGTNAIGKLAANGGVIIGDVNVVSEIPGTAATNLGKAEDAAAASGDTGIATFGVRNDALTAAQTNATGDYGSFSIDTSGIQIVAGAPRALKGRAAVTITSSTAETTVLAATASTFHDAYGLVLTNTSATATKVTIRDATGAGTATVFEVPATDTRGFMLPLDSAIPQGAVNTVWTAQCGTSVASLEVTLLYVSRV